MRILAPTCNGVSRRLQARTGAPAIASTALIPTVRSSVLLPDIFEPLTRSTRVESKRRTLLRMQVPDGISGCPISVASKHGTLDQLGKRIAGMLVAVRAQAQQRLDLANSAQP